MKAENRSTRTWIFVRSQRWVREANPHSHGGKAFQWVHTLVNCPAPHQVQNTNPPCPRIPEWLRLEGTPSSPSSMLGLVLPSLSAPVLLSIHSSQPQHPAHSPASSLPTESSWVTHEEETEREQYTPRGTDLKKAVAAEISRYWRWVQASQVPYSQNLWHSVINCTLSLLKRDLHV